jgi:predicted Zn-dependent peptidase
VTFQPPVPTVRTLKNGLRVWIVEQHQVPLATVELVVRAGEDTDPSGKPGTASFVGDMLDEGTTLRDAPAIAAAFEDQAALFRTQADKDSLIAAVSFPSASLSPVLDVFSDACSTPRTSPDLERRAPPRRPRPARGGPGADRQDGAQSHGLRRAPLGLPTTDGGLDKAARGDQLAWHRAGCGRTTRCWWWWAT